MFIVRDKEAGNEIAKFWSYPEAVEAMLSYEAEDKKNGDYTPEFYEVVGLLSYDELAATAQEYCESKFDNPDYDGYDFLNDIMVDGEGDVELADGTHECWFFVPNKYIDFCGRIIRYDRVIKNNDGEIIEYIPIGYAID